VTDQTTALALPSSGGEMTSATILRGLHTVKAVLAPDLSDDELKLFAMVAARSGLDPFAKQVYAVKRKGRVTFQTGIDGYRSIAARTGMYDGQDEPEFGPVCGCGDKRPEGHPEFATVRVYRKGVTRPIGATAYWHEYKPEGGESGRGDDMWRRMPRVMIAKVAEALALRKAFPYDPDAHHGIGADLYTTEEMAQAERSVSTVAPSTARERVAARRAAAEAKPVEVATVSALTSGQDDGSAAPTEDGKAVDADGVITDEDLFAEADLGAAEEPAGLTRDEFVRRLGTLVPPLTLANVNKDTVARITDGQRTKPSELLPADWLALAIEMGLA
jgi:phage recombination protein Bet